MSRIHIALVGGQPVPVYLGVKDDHEARQVVLVHSAKSRTEAERIAAMFPNRTFRYVECSPVDLSDISRVAEGLFAEYKDNSVTVNLTSGTKLWTLGFFRVFLFSDQARFIYVDQNNVITDIQSRSQKGSSIDKLDLFKLYGTRLDSCRLYTDYTPADFDVVTKVDGLRRSFKSVFFELDNKVKQSLCDGGHYETKGGSFVTYSPENSRLNLDLVNMRYGYRKHVKLQSPHVLDLVFNAGWFELKTAKAICENNKVGEVLLNCKFADQEGIAKNEIDIIAEIGNRLLFVECKTMIHEATDIDKFRSAVRNFSGTGSMLLFVTNDEIKESNRLVYNHAIEKCRDNQIESFNFAFWKDHILTAPSINDIINQNINQQNKR